MCIGAKPVSCFDIDLSPAELRFLCAGKCGGERALSNDCQTAGDGNQKAAQSQAEHHGVVSTRCSELKAITAPLRVPLYADA